jgi:hypothetical protein
MEDKNPFNYNSFPLEQFDKTKKFKIPDRFIKALNSLHPEIDKLVICDIDRVAIYNPETFQLTHRFELKVNIHIKNEDFVKGSSTYYTETLNETFKITYVDMDFVVFNVSLIVTPRLTNLELFYKVFGDE